jgi:hypothetical protein
MDLVAHTIVNTSSVCSKTYTEVDIPREYRDLVALAEGLSEEWSVTLVKVSSQIMLAQTQWIWGTSEQDREYDSKRTDFDQFAGYKKLHSYVTHFLDWFFLACALFVESAFLTFRATCSLFYWFATNVTYRSLLLGTIALVDPWVSVVFFLGLNIVYALLLPLVVVLGYSLYCLFIIALFDYYIPGIAWVFAASLSVYVLYKKIRYGRVYESASTVWKTVLYFVVLGIFIDFANYFYGNDPRILYIGVVTFIVYAVGCFLRRRTVVIQYTITPWIGNTGGKPGRPEQIRIEVDFPFTVLRAIDHIQCWWIGVPWKVVTDAIASIKETFVFGEVQAELNPDDFPKDAVRGDPHRPDLVLQSLAKLNEEYGQNWTSMGGAHSAIFYMKQRTGKQVVTRDDFASISSEPPNSWTSELEAKMNSLTTIVENLTKAQKDVLKVDPLAKIVSIPVTRDPKTLAVSFAVTHQVPLEVEWVNESKGKNKGGRGRFMTLAKTTGAAPVPFKRIKSPFWMSDPDVDFIRMAVDDADDFVPFEDWDSVQGYVEVVMMDGTVQRVFYDEDSDLDDEDVSNLLYRPLSYGIHSSECKLVRVGETVEVLTLLLRKKESNGTVNSLPAPPKSSFVNPIDAFKPNGCYHHPRCGLKLSSSVTPCGQKCLSGACSHSFKCFVAVSEVRRKPKPLPPIPTSYLTPSVIAERIPKKRGWWVSVYSDGPTFSQGCCTREV